MKWVDEIIFSSTDFRLRREAFVRQKDLSKIAAPADSLKVTSFQKRKSRKKQGEGNMQTFLSGG